MLDHLQEVRIIDFGCAKYIKKCEYIQKVDGTKAF